jgi:hypothetical protein
VLQLNRRIHSHIYQYTSYQAYTNDQLWRQQCQMSRFVDPTTYHVPPKYAAPRDLQSELLPPVLRPAELSETVKTLREVKDAAATTALGFVLEDHFEAEAPVVNVTAGRVEPSTPHGHTHSHSHSHAHAAGGETPTVAAREVLGAARASTPANAHSPHDTASTASATSGSTEKVSNTNSPTTASLTPSSPPVLMPLPPAPPATADATVDAYPISRSYPDTALANTKESPQRLKMRLVSDDSTIYKTCFKEQTTPQPSPNLASIHGHSNHGASNSRFSLLRASFAGIASPNTLQRKRAESRNSLPTPTRDGRLESENQVSSYTYGGEVPSSTTYEGADVSRLSVSNLPEHFDGDCDGCVGTGEDAAHTHGTSVSATDVAEQSATPTSQQSGVKLNAGTVPGVRSVPVSAHGDSPDRHHGGGGSAHASKSRRHHNSSSPRSYLTANALKANDRALNAPACTCAMCTTFAASMRLQRLPKYTEGQFGSAYARSSRVMSFLSTASTPVVSAFSASSGVKWLTGSLLPNFVMLQEIINILSLASKWLLRDAIDASGNTHCAVASLLRTYHDRLTDTDCVESYRQQRDDRRRPTGATVYDGADQRTAAQRAHDPAGTALHHYRVVTAEFQSIKALRFRRCCGLFW